MEGLKQEAAVPSETRVRYRWGGVLEQAVEKRHEEVGMHGARERGSEAYLEYVEVPNERQHRRPAPQ